MKGRKNMNVLMLLLLLHQASPFLKGNDWKIGQTDNAVQLP